MCEINTDDYETTTCWRETEHRARKDHTCRTCGAVIVRGQYYRRYFAVTDKWPSAEKQCLPCADAASAFSKEHGVKPFPSNLPETLSECISEGGPDADKWRQLQAQIRARGATK